MCKCRYWNSIPKNRSTSVYFVLNKTKPNHYYHLVVLTSICFQRRVRRVRGLIPRNVFLNTNEYIANGRWNLILFKRKNLGPWSWNWSSIHMFILAEIESLDAVKMTSHQLVHGLHTQSRSLGQHCALHLQKYSQLILTDVYWTYRCDEILYALLKVSSSKREIATWQHAREAHGPVGRAEDQTARGLEFNSPTVQV